MKKLNVSIFVTLFLLSVSALVAFAQNNIEISIDGNAVYVSGTAGAGAYKKVTMQIRDPNSNLVYVNQGTSGEDGSYEFIFRLPSNALNGEYTVMIGGEGIDVPKARTFTYTSEDVPNESGIYINGNVVTVSGVTEAGAGKKVTIQVRDENNNLVYVNQGISGQDGSYEFIFRMPSNALNGEYTVMIGGEGMDVPTTRAFTYTSQDDPGEGRTITAQININGNVITVSGVTEAGAGKKVTIQVRDENNKLIYVNQGKSQADKSFEFIFTIPGPAANGVYTVLLGGEGIDVPISKTFTYGLMDGEMMTAEISINGNIIIIDGGVNLGTGKAILLVVKDSNGDIVYIDQDLSGQGGRFEFEFPMPSNAISGTYTAFLGVEEIKTYTTKSFLYTPSAQ